jgi:hypothetical protein
MRLFYRVNARHNPDEKAYVDKLFVGVSEADLLLQINYYIQKFGISEAYNLKPQEIIHGNEAEQISTEASQKEVG